ncbi:hypothetical protein vB_PsyM_KIL3b_0139 [Pseudomonas phage vB_PsyM_KIL3b]|uniref:DUF7277 domain-containing protein n=3 Tax=Pseudomonas phage vB_PsyM_KIL1 TaxID=1777065 RepID=A0A142IG49_9CAUD|nr:hypothetical protein BH774_gp064 [Pseudomonas phage vB_PsyM_KIL1]AMR57385.1 hypothetical protein vB_PsyM_KIL1_0138 [Pseudomonas phage vB_PsyM_KIL1]AMR57706.1 hypothetical protein vB_PsyM_KIL3_0139 [Pseudomonas phage vB_PsyM_KIL3]AMR58204.1 hypothetical protein vB_PsyM_KIL3b_0139 [Pseudomonas phage vB_PsyM_KIL3b]
MLLIGSRALIRNNPELESQRKCVDWDFICTLDQFRQWHRHHKGRLQFAVPTQGGKYYHARDKQGVNFEFELAWQHAQVKRIRAAIEPEFCKKLPQAMETRALFIEDDIELGVETNYA